MLVMTMMYISMSRVDYVDYNVDGVDIDVCVDATDVDYLMLTLMIKRLIHQA